MIGLCVSQCSVLLMDVTSSGESKRRLGDEELIIIIIGIQPLRPSGQRPEINQATGMSLVRCILGKFLGVVCHFFPPHKGKKIHFSLTVSLTKLTCRRLTHIYKE